MIAIDEERARPDVDGELVVGGEIVIEPDQQQLFDLGVAARRRLGGVGACGLGAERIGHQGALTGGIIASPPPEVQRDSRPHSREIRIGRELSR